MAERPTSLLLRKDLAGRLGGLGKSRILLGDLRLAEADFERSRAVIDEIVRANPKVIEYLDIQAETYLYWGQLLAERGQTGQARAVLRKVIDVERDLLRLNPTLANSLGSLAEGDVYLARVEREAGRFDLRGEVL